MIQLQYLANNTKNNILCQIFQRNYCGLIVHDVLRIVRINPILFHNFLCAPYKIITNIMEFHQYIVPLLTRDIAVAKWSHKCFAFQRNIILYDYHFILHELVSQNQHEIIKWMLSPEIALIKESDILAYSLSSIRVAVSQNHFETLKLLINNCTLNLCGKLNEIDKIALEELIFSYGMAQEEGYWEITEYLSDFINNSVDFDALRGKN